MPRTHFPSIRPSLAGGRGASAVIPCGTVFGQQGYKHLETPTVLPDGTRGKRIQSGEGEREQNTGVIGGWRGIAHGELLQGRTCVDEVLLRFSQNKDERAALCHYDHGVLRFRRHLEREDSARGARERIQNAFGLFDTPLKTLERLETRALDGGDRLLANALITRCEEDGDNRSPHNREECEEEEELHQCRAWPTWKVLKNHW